MLALALAPAAVLSLLLTAAGPAPARWDHVGYDAEDSYFNPHETAITAATVDRLTRRWSVRLRESDTCAGFGRPVVAGGRVYVGDQAGISAYAAATGAEEWTFDWVDDGEAGVPRLAVADGLLVAGYNDCYSVSDPNTRMTALDAATGSVRWSTATPAIRNLVVDKGVIAISSSDISGETVSGAYRLHDGRRLWTATNRGIGGTSADGTVVAVTTDDAGVGTGQTVALDITSGAVRWTRKGYLDANAAAPSGESFYGAGADGGLVAMDVTDGTVRWTAPAPEESYEAIATDGPRVYRSYGMTVTALDSGTGRQVWSRELADHAGQPLVAGGLVYARGVALDAGRGTVVTESPALEGDVVVTGGMLLQTHDGVLSAYTP